MNLKKSLSLLLAGAMALSLAACGAKEEPAASAPAASKPAASAPAAAETVDITLATYPIGKWSDEATVNGLIADFNAAYPDIKLREGMNIGAKVTLRGDRMYEFVDRLFNVALPRVRDFRGINPNSFDGRGNYNMGLKEQLIFPEIDYDKIDKVRGMDLCFVTTATTDEEARELLTLMGAPFAK